MAYKENRHTVDLEEKRANDIRQVYELRKRGIDEFEVARTLKMPYLTVLEFSFLQPTEDDYQKLCWSRPNMKPDDKYFEEKAKYYREEEEYRVKLLKVQNRLDTIDEYTRNTAKYSKEWYNQSDKIKKLIIEDELSITDIAYAMGIPLEMFRKRFGFGKNAK